jgi:4-coumarate--CoA ligase
VSLIPIQKDLGYLDVAGRLVQSGARLIFIDNALLNITETALALIGVIPVITLEEVDPRYPHIDVLLKQEVNAPRFYLSSASDSRKHIAFINSTSGSTGKMKSVLTSHAHFIAVMEATRATIPENTNPDEDVWTSTISLGYYICGKLFMGLNVLLGIPVVLLNNPLNHTSLDLITRHKVSFLFITPTLAAQIAKADTTNHDFSSIKWLLSAGAPMHEKLRSSVAQQLNGQHLALEWGTTETMLLALQVDEQSSIAGSSGTLVNGIEAKVIDTETGDELGPGEEGEILVRNSLCPFVGYKDNDEANKEFDSEGFFHTGDVGYLDSTCNVFIKDRLKELLRVGEGYGSRISTSDLESALFDHPAVASAVVVGIRDESTQVYHPTAFVILQPGYDASIETAKEIEKHSTRELTGLKQLSGGIYFVHKYPTVGFKINRGKLKSLIHIEEGQVKAPMTHTRLLEMAA